MFNKYKLYLLFIWCLAFNVMSCKKFIEVDAPVTSTNAINVYENDNTAIAVLTGIYTNMSGSFFIDGITSISLYPELSADNLSLYDLNGQAYTPYYINDLKPTGPGTPILWNNIYPIIYVANAAIEGLNKSTSLTPSVKDQLMGEARFVRAFCFFYLTNLYGDIPVPLGTDYKTNATLERSSSEKVYEQIIFDLKEAQRLLNTQFVGIDAISASAERVRPNKGAATALLARAFLYKADYVNAEMLATAVINSPLYDTAALNDVFLKNSREAIWQLQPVGVNENTKEAILFILPEEGPSIARPIFLSNQVMSNFETGDLRKRNWTDSVIAEGVTYYYAYKYKAGLNVGAVSEYEMVLRLAEQYLIRSEARVRQGNLTGGLADLNVVRKRAGLAPSVANTAVDLLSAIQHERQAELFTEWGDRWFDLKRTGKVNEVMEQVTPFKGGIWNSNWQLYPIPLTELQANPNLVQNPGYN